MSTLHIEPNEESEGPTLSEALRQSLNPATTRSAGKNPDDVSVREAKKSARVRHTESERSNVRVLFVTTEAVYLEPGRSEQQQIADIAQFVAEVHIMLVRKGRGEPTVERPMSNVWVYHVYGAYRPMRVWNARVAAKHHLRFAGVVRPDIVVALDPFESALVAYYIARLLERPWQVHMLINPFSLDWLTQKPGHQQLAKLARRMLKRALSVRASTTTTVDAVRTRFPKLTDVMVLPRRYNLAAYKTASQEDIHDIYRQFSFIMLAEGPLQADSHLHGVLAATHQLLHNQKIGLVIIGLGRSKKLFQEKAALLGVSHNVVFVDDSINRPLYYQTADVFLEADATQAGDERIVRAIAAYTPVVAYSNEFRASFLTHKESAMLCEKDDSYALGQAVRTLLNDTAMRIALSRRAGGIAQDQIHEDVTTYYQAYRSSITSAITDTTAK